MKQWPKQQISLPSDPEKDEFFLLLLALKGNFIKFYNFHLKFICELSSLYALIKNEAIYVLLHRVLGPDHAERFGC